MDYMSQIKPYIANHSGKKPSEKHLTDFIEYALSIRAERIDDAILSSYAERLKARGYQESTISRKIIPECKKFIRWCETEKGEDNMTAERQAGHDANEGLTDMPVNENENDSPDTHKGRKLKGNEARTQKVSIYMPPSLYAELNDLAHFGRKSVGDILISLTEEYVRQNAKRLEIFRRAIQEANLSD